MQTTLLQEELFDSHIAVTKACVEATTSILEHQGQLVQAVLEIPKMSIAGIGQVSRTIFSTGITCSLTAATMVLESFGPRIGANILSNASTPAPALSPKGGTRRPKAIAAA